MQRREFVKASSLLTIGLGLGLSYCNVKNWYKAQRGPVKLSDLEAVSGKLEADFEQLLGFMRSNGWSAYLKEVLGVNLALSGKDLKIELIKEIDKNRLTALRQNDKSGYDDFSGERLVQPGFPAFSLLFHTLASPRVRPNGIIEYPSLAQIDLLENYIYALAQWNQLKAIYETGRDKDLVLAVFAYEYRPAFKTPHHAFADMVYSRTGIARIGNQPMHYDNQNRCYITKPADEAQEKNVAVMPARYGLFIARKVKHKDISLIRSGVAKHGDCKVDCEDGCRDDRSDGNKTFLQPIRKVFNDDLLVGSGNIEFTEEHKSEKLKKLATAAGIKMWKDIIPEPRLSNELIVQDAVQCRAGSSFLLISQPADLIRPGMEKDQPLFFWVPEGVSTPYENRYFTAFCTQEVEDVELLLNPDSLPLTRSYNKYPAPRNQPMFVNISNIKNKEDAAYSPILRTEDESYEDKFHTGKYYAALFEDSICDGKVDVKTNALKLDKLKGIKATCLPAFSIVTAPDFFPQVDPLDLVDYDISPGTSDESNFFEGGVASLATARIKPNPKMIETKNETTADTYLAVLSGYNKEETNVSPGKLAAYKNPLSDRGYEISGFLPDVASSVFAPGWDVTYCSLENIHDIYIGTEGLGSPFVEDMKFCAALNGMWPATSPDAARTFQGANEADYRNPTAVPLLDNEIGICAKGPAGQAFECTGWDGEQGPYLELVGKQWKVNFTDVGRSDAVNNTLDGNLDMSVLRKLRSFELINRMACLKLSIKSLPQKNFYEEIYKSKVTAYTYLWLVSAEKVNWGVEDAAALGIPNDLVGNNKEWITAKANARINGEGYLYVFASTSPDGVLKDWEPDLKRRRLDCERIFVCQVTNNANDTQKIAWTEIVNGTTNWQVK